MTPARRSMALMAAFTALWAAVEALAGALSRPYSPYQVVFTRYVVHLAFMAAVWGWRDPASLWRTARPAYQLARAAMMIAMPVSFVLALRRGVPDRTVLAVFAVTPLLILGLARSLLGERARWMAWAAAAVAAAGAAVALEPARPAEPWLLALPLGMAAAFSLYVVMTRSLRTESTRANLFFTAAGVAGVLALDMPRVWIWPSAGDALVMAGIGLTGWVALWALDRLAALSPVSVVAPASALYAASSLAGSALAGHRAPAPLAAGALALVVLACGVVWAHPLETLLEPTR